MSNQAKQVAQARGGLVSFAGTSWPEPYSKPLEELSCPVSLYRAAMLSRQPGRVHELGLILSEHCFDVMMMRRWEPRLTSALTAGLVIADLTHCDTPGQFDEECVMLMPEGVQLPVMYLVNETLMNSASTSMLDKELLVWPARSAQTLMYQIQRSIRVYAASQPEVMSESPSREVYKDLWIDRDKMTVQRRALPVHLTKTEYSLLILLLDSKGAVRTREDLMSEIWDTDFLGGSNVVDVHIKSLRKKLGDHAGAPQYIATVRGVGYRLAD
ncbi:winged helix-turn-helix domain-containing protein [Paenibacillus sp. JSM ZJ436]|uniref:winged helix-turn-helix domain-containing protein n=1 Tax=Paenibacillus sp. JSM ZJ436 TaxID=3376190 RepID=UPI00378AB325